ncbi:MAG TPA: hypothetical protein VFO18_03080 [Methylomirabilota bacterium]|nr:hypothetical protein [Methylomirabilota bacterium]
MKRLRLRRTLLGAGAGLLLAGCVVAEPVPVVVRTPPPAPPPRVEVVPVQPVPGHVWVQGHWAWRNGAYAWVPGHWEATRPDFVWVPGHWAPRAGGYVWIEGHWRGR